MYAAKGDRLIVPSRTAGQPDQALEIVEVLGANGGPPYRVRSEDGHETIMNPEPGTVVERSKDGDLA